MEIVEVPIEKLKPNKVHLRIGLKENDSIFKYLLASVVNFGLQLPLLINKDYEVISGDQLLKVLKFLNYEKVPCIITDCPSEKVSDLRIALNKIHGEWFISGLRKYFKEHKYPRGRLEALGFDSLEVDCLMSLDKFPSLKEEKIEETENGQLKIF